jgi:hypothetical protein
MTATEALRFTVRAVNPRDLAQSKNIEWTGLTPRHLRLIKSIPPQVCDRAQIYGRVHIDNAALEFALSSIIPDRATVIRDGGAIITGVCSFAVAMQRVNEHLSKGGLVSVKIDRLMDGTGADLMSGDDRVALSFALGTADRKLVAAFDVPLNIMFE